MFIILYSLEAGDESLAAHLEQAKRNAKYATGVIQNQLINIKGKQILGMILQDVHKGSQFYNVQPYETQDAGNIEQFEAVFVM